MEMFRFGNVSSEDLMRPGGTDAKRFLGVVFKMGAGEPAAARKAPPEDPPPAKAEAPEKVAFEPAKKEEPKEEAARWTEATLAALSKEDLTAVAASIGVLDLKQAKDKLVQAVLERQ